MEGSAIITVEDVSRLAQFHREHFPSQVVPDVHTNDKSQETALATADASDLGYYEDGTRRTLTDDQIAMFRHSEIQRLLTARRHKRMAEEEEEEEKVQSQLQREAKQARRLQNAKPTRFDDDTSVHERSHVNELSYDENTSQSKERAFQWPVLGA